jgi:hypothetical protein
MRFRKTNKHNNSSITDIKFNNLTKIYLVENKYSRKNDEL